MYEQPQDTLRTDDLVRLIQSAVPLVSERVMVFLDWGYLATQISQRWTASRLDVSKLGLRLARGRRLLRTYMYDGKIEGPPDDHWKERQRGQQSLEASLSYAESVEIRWGRLQFSDKNVPRQKGVDVLLSIDMLRFALKDNYDTAVLASGDGDYTDIVRMVKDEGKSVEVASFQSSTARSLRQAADILVELDDDLLKDCWHQTHDAWT